MIQFRKQKTDTKNDGFGQFILILFDFLRYWGSHNANCSVLHICEVFPNETGRYGSDG